MEDTVVTLRPDKRAGVSLARREYELIATYMLTAIDRADDLTLSQLLARAGQDLQGKVAGDCSWKMLQVKMDLEARTFIEMTPMTRKRHSFALRITRQGRSKIRYEHQVAEWAGDN